jgi:hypothetical protein
MHPPLAFSIAVIHSQSFNFCSRISCSPVFLVRETKPTFLHKLPALNPLPDLRLVRDARISRKRRM